jgi:hypothetical protein
VINADGAVLAHVEVDEAKYLPTLDRVLREHGFGPHLGHSWISGLYLRVERVS